MNSNWNFWLIGGGRGQRRWGEAVRRRRKEMRAWVQSWRTSVCWFCAQGHACVRVSMWNQKLRTCRYTSFLYLYWCQAWSVSRLLREDTLQCVPVSVHKDKIAFRSCLWWGRSQRRLWRDDFLQHLQKKEKKIWTQLREHYSWML